MSSRIRRASRNWRNYYVRKSEKFQFVPFSVNLSLPEGVSGGYQVICPASTVAGMRKVKNIGFDVITNSPEPLLFTVFYLPEGTNVTSVEAQINQVTYNNEGVQTGGTNFSELFAANQWIIGCGSMIAGAVTHFRSRMARNLNNGDVIILLVHTGTNQELNQSVRVSVTGSYAIKYN